MSCCFPSVLDLGDEALATEAAAAGRFKLCPFIIEAGRFLLPVFSSGFSGAGGLRDDVVGDKDLVALQFASFASTLSLIFNNSDNTKRGNGKKEKHCKT